MKWTSREGSRLVLSLGTNASWSHDGIKYPICGNRSADVMMNANSKQAQPNQSKAGERIGGLASMDPPSANHPPKTKRSRQNGLKCQTPVGKAARFQSKWRAAT